MPSQVPSFDNATIAQLALELYGIEGEISAFVSYEDQNACIKTSSDSYVLKIANKKWRIEELQLQTEALEHLRTTATELSVRIARTAQEREEGLSGHLVAEQGEFGLGARRSPEHALGGQCQRRTVRASRSRGGLFSA